MRESNKNESRIGEIAVSEKSGKKKWSVPVWVWVVMILALAAGKKFVAPDMVASVEASGIQCTTFCNQFSQCLVEREGDKIKPFMNQLQTGCYAGCTKQAKRSAACMNLPDCKSLEACVMGQVL